MDGVGKGAGTVNSGSLRPLVAVIASVVSFALLVETAGLVPAVIASVLVASRGSREFKPRDALVFGVCFAAAIAIVFVVLLRQPFALVRHP